MARTGAAWPLAVFAKVTEWPEGGPEGTERTLGLPLSLGRAQRFPTVAVVEVFGGCF